MRLAVIAFTREGSLLCRKLTKQLQLSGDICQGYARREYLELPENLERCLNGETYAGLKESLNPDRQMYPLEEPVGAWTGRMFAQMDGLIYIGACGIAVRAIAPYLKDKFTDPAVVVVDELHHHAISLLSGHVGGANDLTKKVARILDAEPVITTATDVHGKSAIDVWAKEHDLVITSRKKAKEVAMRILEGKKVGFAVDPEVESWYRAQFGTEAVPDDCRDHQFCAMNVVISCRSEADPEWLCHLPWKCGDGQEESEKSGDAEALILCPKFLTVGIGCRKGTSAEQIEKTVKNIFREHNLSLQAVCRLASIDLKKEEEGILKFAADWNVPFQTFSAEELLAVPGDFLESGFVKKITGVGNVCERAAIRASGPGSRLLIKKQAGNGVTVAAAMVALSHVMK